MSLRLERDRAEGEGTRDAATDSGTAPARPMPIVVDLDGTLVLTDTLEEATLFALLRRPAALLALIPSLAGGRRGFRSALCREIDLSGHPLPIRDDLVRWLSEKAAEGHEIHLCTDVPVVLAKTIAGRLDVFSSIIECGGSAEGTEGKAHELATRFPDGFIYVAGHRRDLPLLAASRGIVLAGAGAELSREARRLGTPLLGEFVSPPLGFEDMLRFLRVHHWMKNVLLFVPLILAHQWHDLHLLLETVLAFVCLIAVTSGTYLLNDIADLGSDRRHWSKRNRAMASGRLAISTGLLIAVALIGCGVAGALLLSMPFALVLLSYLALTLAYSIALKSIPLLDILVIGILFTLRLVMGAVLIDQTKPAWLLTFAVFFFVSLATAKRHTEIVRAQKTDPASITARGYEVEDAPLTLAMGAAAAVASIVVLFIFIVLEMLPGNAYGVPEFLAGIPLVLSIWLGRVWLLAHRGRMNDDPVSFAVRDRISLLLGALVAALFLAAL